MPTPISNTVRRALSDGRLTADEINQLRAAVKTGEVKPDELKLLSARYGDLFQEGAGTALRAITGQQNTVILPPIRSIGDSRAAATVLSGMARKGSAVHAGTLNSRPIAGQRRPRRGAAAPARSG